MKARLRTRRIDASLVGRRNGSSERLKLQVDEWHLAHLNLAPQARPALMAREVNLDHLEPIAV